MSTQLMNNRWLWLVTALWVAWGLLRPMEGASGTTIRVLVCALNVVVSWRAASQSYDRAEPKYNLSSPRSAVFILPPLALLQVLREVGF